MKKYMIVFSLLLIVTACLFANGQSETQSSAITDDGVFKPTKDVTFVVGFDAGGSADIPARVVAKYMSKYSGVNVTVTNIVGSAGKIAANQVKDMKADGYTLLHVPVGYFLNAALGNFNLTYKDFEPVTMWCDSWVGLVVRADSPWQTYEEYVAYAKANPGAISIGSVSGTLPQEASLAIIGKEGIELNMIDIGSNNKATELLGGRIDSYIDACAQFRQYVDSGDFRCLMAFAYDGTDIPGYPGLTTAEELGYTDFDYLLQSFGMWAPKGTPKAAVDYWADIIRQCAEDPECQKELNALGYGTRFETPEDYAKICENVLNGTTAALKSAGLI